MAQITIRFSAKAIASYDAIELYYRNQGCQSITRHYRENGQPYAIEVRCNYFSKWHLLDVIRAVGNDDIFFGVTSDGTPSIG